MVRWPLFSAVTRRILLPFPQTVTAVTSGTDADAVLRWNFASLLAAIRGRHAMKRDAPGPIGFGDGRVGQLPARIDDHPERGGTRAVAPDPGGSGCRRPRSGLCRPDAAGQSERPPRPDRHRAAKQYLAAVMASGAAVGSAAAFPGIGTAGRTVGGRGRDGRAPRGDAVFVRRSPRCTAFR